MQPPNESPLGNRHEKKEGGKRQNRGSGVQGGCKHEKRNLQKNWQRNAVIKRKKHLPECKRGRAKGHADKGVQNGKRKM